MSDYAKLKELAEAATGLSDVSLAPDVVLALIAENEALTKRLEVDPRHSYDGIATRDATIKALDEQADQLKAENAGLKTGYEAYEQTVKELRAEVEALRKAVLAAREFIMHEAEVRGLLDENNEVSFRHPRRQAAIAIIDAAMGKGERS